MDKFSCVYCCRKILAKNYNKHLLRHKFMKNLFEDDLRKKLGEAIGEASMCWSETPKGVFETEKASKIVDKLVTWIKKG